MCDASENLVSVEMICASVLGASHAKVRMPCEDYGLVRKEDDYAVFAVADGHGDANCPRSSIGSRMACKIACVELSTFAREAREATYSDEDGSQLTWENRLLDDRLAGATVRQLVTSIVGNWRDAVLGELEGNPLSEAERSGALGYIERYDKGERLEHIYGTTLIAGLMTERYLLLLQQGDGRCLLFSRDGSESQPIPWDDACFANVTTSMCDDSAVEEFRFYAQDLASDPIAACIAGTDGVEDSFFSMDQLHSYYRELLLDAAKSSVADSERRLMESLPNFTARGSGDDVTICGLIDSRAVRALVRTFEARNEVDNIKSELSLIEDRLKSMEGKLEHLNEKRREAECLEAQAARNTNEAHVDRERCQLDSDTISVWKASILQNLSKQLQEWLFRGADDQLSEAESRLSEAQIILRNAAEASRRAREEHESYLALYEENIALRDELVSKLCGDVGETGFDCKGLETQAVIGIEVTSERTDALADAMSSDIGGKACQ